MRRVDFGKVWNASGAQGFFGEGFSYHHAAKILGLSFKNITFVSKTSTIYPTMGNMPLREDFTPQELLPKSIIVKPLRGVALNSVSLSNPGIQKLLQTGKWQERKTPFIVSFSPTHPILPTTSKFVEIVRMELRKKPMQAPWALQVNYSCPNSKEISIRDIGTSICCLKDLGIPIFPKVSFLWHIEDVFNVSEFSNVLGISLTNSIPYGTPIDDLPTARAWNKLFGTYKPGRQVPVSPFTKHGWTPGGLSGKYLLRPTAGFVTALRQLGYKKHINAGGGILNLADAKYMFDSGADSISLGSITFLRPWKMREIIHIYTGKTHGRLLT